MERLAAGGIGVLGAGRIACAATMSLSIAASASVSRARIQSSSA
jgi:hypothetical protein